MHPNAERVVQGMANFSTGNHEALKDVFAEDAEWIFGGRSRFAGRYKGRDEVLRWLRDIQTATGTEVKPLSILGSDRHVIVLNDLTSGRGERRSRTTEAFCCVMNDRGQIQKFYQLNADQDAYDTSIAGL